MEVRKGFKQTELGVIPSDWDVVSARDACSKIQDGTHFSPKISGNDFLYVTSKNIRFGYLDLSTAGRIDAKQHEAIYRRCDVKKGDLLLTKDGANTGNAALNTLDEEFSLLSSVAFLRFNPSKHCAAYFLQQVLSSQGQHQIQDAMSGNAITRLTLEKINKLKFPIPSKLAEQEAIAEALSDADALIEAVEQLLTKKRQVKQGAMSELLTGKRRLAGFSGEWSEKNLGDIAEITKLAGFEYSKYFNSYKDGGDIIVIRGTNITHNKLDLSDIKTIPQSTSNFLQRSKLQKGDLVFAYVGTIGPVYLITENNKYHLGPNTARITVKDNVSPRFVFWYFCSSFAKKEIDEHISVGAQPSLSMTKIRKFKIALPEYSEQTAIAEILSDMDAEISALEEKLVKARQVKAGMMSELLTGKIRLNRD
jgi:type I restriction enzyme S subunit